MTVKQFYDRVQRNAVHQGFGNVTVKYRNGKFFISNTTFIYEVRVNDKFSDGWIDFCRIR